MPVYRHDDVASGLASRVTEIPSRSLRSSSVSNGPSQSAIRDDALREVIADAGNPRELCSVRVIEIDRMERDVVVMPRPRWCLPIARCPSTALVVGRREAGRERESRFGAWWRTIAAVARTPTTATARAAFRIMRLVHAGGDDGKDRLRGPVGKTKNAMAIEHAPNAAQGHDFRIDATRKWQDRWEADRLYATRLDDSRPPYYTMEMLPYPSGDLHVGHAKNYTLGDAVRALDAHARIQRAASAQLGRLRIAGGKRRDPARDRAARLDPKQHRKPEATDSLARHRLRLVA